MRVGVHCSVRNGFTGALEEAARLGCETLQIFTQSPRGWMTRTYTDQEFADFRLRREQLGLDPVVVHSPYLPNLCTSAPELYARSLRTLKDDLLRCEKLGAAYLVIHPGAYSPDSNLETGLSRIHAALNEALATVKGTSRILIENMAGGGRRIGAPFSEVAKILNGVVDQNRIGVCFDTCHATGAGYDLSSESAVAKVLSEFEREIGLSRIFAFHVNDSKGDVGSHRDLHQHLGKGFVGRTGFEAIFANSAFARCALILETPKDSPRADLVNLKFLRSCLPEDAQVKRPTSEKLIHG